jgi:hypothetical protein
MAFTASYTAPWTMAMPRIWPCAVGLSRMVSACAIAFQSLTAAACC